MARPIESDDNVYDDEPQESDLDVEVTVEYTNWFLYSYMYFSYQAQTSCQYVMMLIIQQPVVKKTYQMKMYQPIGCKFHRAL